MVADDPESFADLDGHSEGDVHLERPCMGGNGGPCEPVSPDVIDQKDKVNASQAKAKAMTPAGLAAQVPASVKKAIADSIKASNDPSKAAGDKQGGFHEEGGVWGKNAKGEEVPVPAVPGQVADPRKNREATIDVEKAADPTLKASLTDTEGQWHVHPLGVVHEGNSTSFFKQEPGERDFANAKYNINIAVGADNNRVYFYNHDGIIGKPMKLGDFIKAGSP
jgi:hypothetical protein